MQDQRRDSFSLWMAFLEKPPSRTDAVLERRKPMLLLRLPGVLLLRLATRQFCGLLFHDPPRMTRLEPV